MERSSPFQKSPHSWLFCIRVSMKANHQDSSHLPYRANIRPQSVTCSAASFQGKVVCIHCCRLAAIIARFVGVLVVHVIRNSNLGKETRMYACVLQTFFADCCKLVSKAVSNCRFAQF